MVPKNINQVELKRVKRNITGRAGLSWIAGMLKNIGFFEEIDRISPVEGKSNNELAMSKKMMSEIMSRIDGASAIEDVEVLRKDRGLRRITGERIVSADTIRNILKGEKTERIIKGANRWLVVKALKASKIEELTYDNDATYMESRKGSASYSYRETKDHSGLLGFIAELNLCVTMDFRTGRISPKEGIKEQIEKVIAITKEAGKKLCRVRIDSAGHKNEIFNLCEREGIKYYITLAQNKNVKELIHNIKESEWKKSKGTDREYAESVYVTNKGAMMRMIAIRWEKKEQMELFSDRYSYHVVGTNDNDNDGEHIMEIHAGRMGSENYNKELKGGYNCEWSPSNNFRMNGNYFYMGVLAYNCVEIVKRFFIRDVEVEKYRIKRFRQWFIKMSGKIVKSGRKYYFHLINVTDKSYEMAENIWRRLQYPW